MSYAQRHVVDITTIADQSGEGYTPPVTGKLIDIQYIKDDFTNGVDFTVSGEDTGRQFWRQDNVDASAVVAPRQPTHDYTGTASLYAGQGEPVEDYFVLDNERIKVAVATGGASKGGQFLITVAGP